MTTMQMAQDERTAFVELLETLTTEQWEAPTLCGDWSVRLLVAHVYSYEDVPLPRVVLGMLRTRDTDRSNAERLEPFVRDTPEQLLDRARRCVRPRGLTAMLGGRIALTDGTIHQQDVRRPLGLPREIPADRLRVVLDTARTAPTIDARSRLKGLRLSAPDVGWSGGDGLLVEGPGEALLMAMAGRRGVTAELTGDGVPLLERRTAG